MRVRPDAARGRPPARATARRHRTALALYWIDGRRTMREVADLVEAEAGQRDTEALVRVAALLVEGGMLKESR